MEQQKIGNFLKQLRKEKGLTQEQFAERLTNFYRAGVQLALAICVYK